jgi:hypothetical protein
VNVDEPYLAKILFKMLDRKHYCDEYGVTKEQFKEACRSAAAVASVMRAKGCSKPATVDAIQDALHQCLKRFGANL